MKWNKATYYTPILIFIFLFSSLNYGEVNIYGYFSLYYEKVGTMRNANGKIDKEAKADPGEFDYANFIVMLQSNITDKIRAFASLKGPGGIGLQTYWGEYAFQDYLKLRIGKIYRPFGLFNELLDAVPTYLGMEPPELFDKDHLMLPRDGKIMLHGGVNIKNDYLRFAYMLDSDENMLSDNQEKMTLSHSWDINYNFRDIITIGHSGFIANEQNGSSLLGDLQSGGQSGSPRSGVLPWMANDKYSVLGAYLKFKLKGFTIKTAFWAGNHDATRDPDAVQTVYANNSLNGAQLKNFFGDSSYSTNPNSPAVLDDVKTKADFTVMTFFARLGYTILLPNGLQFTPYFFWDFYSNPETIANKKYGGDSEAGVADDGKFHKPTWGITFKPTPYMAVKVDGSSHIQKIDGETQHYNEMRVDLSFFFR